MPKKISQPKTLLNIEDKIVVYTDGGARGNPGPAALGVVVAGREYGEYLGVRTNNYAEYQAVIFALKKVKQLVGKAKAKQAQIEVRMDSELIVRQMNGRYKITEPDLKVMYVDVHNLCLDFASVTFVHVPREQNKAADRMVNKALDEQAK